MHHVTRGGTPNETRIPWALIIVFFVLSVFGIFWYIEQRATPEPLIVPIDTSVNRASRLPDPLDTLEQELSLIEIPDYASLF